MSMVDLSLVTVMMTYANTTEIEAAILTISAAVSSEAVVLTAAEVSTRVWYVSATSVWVTTTLLLSLT